MAAAAVRHLPIRTPEIIDVDLFDDDHATLSRPTQRRRTSPSDSILVLDSDDEAHAARERSTAPRNRSQAHRRRLARRRRLFSPPPPSRDESIPPVPPLPASLPMRRRAPPFPTGVIRSNSQPFAFEASLQSRPPQPRSSPPLQAAPRSHHQPVMGFGGALLSAHNRASGPRASGGGIFPAIQQYISSALQRFTGGPPPVPQPPPHPHRRGNQEILAFLAQAGAYDFGGRHFWRDRRRRDEPEYKPSFTHPIKAAAGYTFNFLPDDDSVVVTSPRSKSSISSKVETTLVCARCLDPLVLGGPGAAAGIEGRLWGLRCGHLLDGKCVAQIMKPLSPTDPTQPAGEKGKNAERAMDVVSFPEDEEPLVDPPQSNSIRSRLRPRPSLSFTPAHLRPSLKRKLPSPPRVKELYEWTCPVTSCNRVHRSVLHHGGGQEWLIDAEMGPVGIYV